MANKPIDVTDDEFNSLIQKNDYVVVDFWAPWCHPCKVVSPVVEALARQYSDRAVFAKVNVDDDQQVALQFKIMGVPTLLFFRKGQLVDRIVGAAPRERIEGVFKKYLV